MLAVVGDIQRALVYCPGSAGRVPVVFVERIGELGGTEDVPRVSEVVTGVNVELVEPREMVSSRGRAPAVVQGGYGCRAESAK